MPDRWQFKFHVLMWGGSRSLIEHAKLCIQADAPVVVSGPDGFKPGELGRWEAEQIIVRIVRKASWSDVLACRRAIGSANRAKPDYPVYVVEALD